MSLRWKVVLLLCGVFVLLMGMIRLIDDTIIFPSFVRLERDEATTNMSRCVRALRSELDHLDALCADWVAGDDVRQIFSSREVAAREDHSAFDVMQGGDLAVLLVFDVDGGPVWGAFRDPGTGESFDPAELVGALPPAMRCAGHAGGEAGPRDAAVRGVVRVGSRVVMLASRQLRVGAAENADSMLGDSAAEVSGTVAMGRLVDDRCRQRLIAQTHVVLELMPLPSAVAGAAAAGSAGSVSAPRRVIDIPGQDGHVFIDESDPWQLAVYYPYADVTGQPALMLKATVPREITAAGAQARDFVLSSLVSLLVIILVLVWMQLEFMVVRPVKHLRDHAVRVGQEADLEARINMSRIDEIGDLCGAFNQMTSSLADYRRRSVATAHRTGMSDVAVNILHNVGNVLNSVSVSTDLLSAAVQQSRVGGLTRAAELIREHQDDLAGFFNADARGRKLPEYLVRLAELLGDEQQGLVTELQSLQTKVQHIREVIASQQALAQGPQLATIERLDALIREAVEIHAPLLRSGGIMVELDLADLPPAPTHRPKLVQILENLIKNAAEAILEQDGPERRIQVTTRAAADGTTATIEIQDTGVGVASADLARIFRSGFTTKPNGHGYGLHYCANAVRELGGEIRVTSPGRGQGATLVLVLPLAGTLRACGKADAT